MLARQAQGWRRAAWPCLALLLVATLPAQAAGGRLLIIALDGVNWVQLRAAPAPHLHRLLATGAVGLMNSRKPGQYNYYHSYITLGAGHGALGSPALLSLERSTVFPGLMRFRVPLEPWQELLQANRQAGADSQPGLLQDTLQGADQSGVLLTARDAPPASLLPAALLLSPGGSVLGFVAPPDNPEAWAQAAQDLAGFPVVLLVFPGAPTSGAMHPLSLQGSGPALRRLAQADRLLGKLLAGPVSLQRDRLLILAINTPPYRQEPDHSLAPVILAGAGVPPGLLTSASTRRPGVVATTDFAPTVLDWLGIPAPAAMSGHPFRVVPAAGAPERLDRLNRQVITTYRLRFPLVRSFIGFQGLVGISGLLFLRPLGNRRWRARLRWLLLFAGAQALAGLFLGPTGVAGTWPALGLAAAISALVATALARLPGIYPLAGLALLTWGALSLDTLAGSPLMRTSVLGYDPILGARFYGLGNEYMGTLVASACLAAGFLSGGRRWPLVAAIGLCTVAVVGAPTLGANWGGALTAAAGLGAVALVLASGRPRRWHLLALLGAMLAVGTVLVLLDLGRAPAQQTHIGRTAALLGQSGWHSLLAVIQRKAAMSWRLLFYSRWSWFLIVVVILVGRLVLRPRRFAAAFRAWPGTQAALTGGLVTAVAACLLNDSGVVAGATSLMITAPGLLFLLVAEGKGAGNG